MLMSRKTRGRVAVEAIVNMGGFQKFVRDGEEVGG
jgi:hypothetical protein